MISVLLATRNGDKFEIIKDLLLTLVSCSMSFSSPDTEGCSRELVEEGCVVDRARSKAHAHLGCCGFGKTLVVGSDDAFRIPDYFGNEIRCDSEQITELIINGKILPGTPVYLVRSFWCIENIPLQGAELGSVEQGCVTEIPFKYLGGIISGGPTKLLHKTYPLSMVLGQIARDVPVAQDDPGQLRLYYSSHSEELRSVLLSLPSFKNFKLN